MPISSDFIAEKLLILVPLWLSLSLHEWAHAWTAWRLGDDTAALMGRLTLNPLAHIDPIGTLLLPLLGVPFGWAKPVPVNPLRFHRGVNMRTGMMITAVAGPVSNLCLAAAFIVVYVAMARFAPHALGRGQPAGQAILMMIELNVILASFNILPIWPLDGSRVADALMPKALRPAWEQFHQLSPVALAAVILLPQFMGIDLFRWPLHATFWLVQEIVRLVVR
ncbi:MAG: site-2 protease family protein [Thermoguttaceae bacterium]